MRFSGKGLWPILSLVMILGACGPNTFRARGTVLHPLHDVTKDNPEDGVAPMLLVIPRKETRVQVKHLIVGPQKRPMALKLLGEFCAIVPDKATTGRLVFDCLLFTNYKEELVDMKHGFTLRLPDGRNVVGRLHAKNKIQDHTETITGAHMQPHQVVRNRETGQVRVLRHIEEVTNEFQLFSRQFKVIFEDRNLLGADTAYVEFQIDGYQRRWIYRFDFTDDADAAMRWWIDHME